MSEKRDILEAINETGGFEQFLSSRKQLVDSLFAYDRKNQHKY